MKSKKIVLIFRIILYSVALYVLADVFIFTESKKNQQQLQLLEKEAQTNYTEFFIQYNGTDSTWNALQTSPLAISNPFSLGTTSPWRNPNSMIETFKSKQYRFVGFYLTQNMLLTADSFFKITDQFDQLGSHSDKRLQSLKDTKSFTAVFIRL